ncbi:hypothetical protein NY08_3617 [Rhodococcus sp. B7740]|nr:hypothetical protein NY08_3617 [Rhodococcus sp. B7740]
MSSASRFALNSTRIGAHLANARAFARTTGDPRDLKLGGSAAEAGDAQNSTVLLYSPNMVRSWRFPKRSIQPWCSECSVRR